MPGADANPYNALIGVVLGMLTGLSETEPEAGTGAAEAGPEAGSPVLPPPTLTGPVASRRPARASGGRRAFPLHLSQAVTRFEQSSSARKFLNAEFHHLLTEVKRAEAQDYDRRVTPLEWQWLGRTV